MINNWKKNTIYISIMQLSLLLVNLFLITIISREYGAETYGEYASSKSLSVLIGTAAVMSLALVVTKVLAQKNENSKLMFQNAYSLIIRNLMIALIILIPLTLLLNRDLPMTILFLVGFVFNEMIHVALAYYQAKGDFVTSSKQIILRTIVYGVGAWVLVLQGFTITSLIIFQVMTLVAFFVVAHLSVPKNDIELTSNTTVKNKLQESGKKMVLTTFSSALISELDIVLLGLFYSGSTLGVLAWARRILEIIFQLVAASLDILFPELAKAKNRDSISELRIKLRKVFLLSFTVPILFIFFKGLASEIFTSLLGEEFSEVSTYTSWILFALPVMVWSRINIIFSRALNFEINITKSILFGSVASIGIYYFVHSFNNNPAVLSIILSQIVIGAITTYSFKKSYE
ncbi:MAG: lipopolysaccharide biosynthesis protein [Candidatus Actinomarina sp.]|jgi:O-antigen/teichoic acid export membrane protein|tara:strand:- start:1038 stop:2243 length:1206 start_codon:yes stop_codon:yes gene_type:complete